jgi:SAM-dependent MidA family methyltransferase
MEMALYYPGLGYYCSTKEKFGKEGDYFTAPFFTNVYGSVIARQLEEMWHHTGKKEFIIAEFGAGSGALCADILTQLEKNTQFFNQLKYCIVEKSDSLRERQRALFSNSAILQKVSWLDSIDEISPFTGCVLANEVLDNFSVHRVIMKEEELMEVFVDHYNGFVERLKPAADDLKFYFKQLEVELPNDFCAEVNLQAIEWIKAMSASLAKGFIITIDYGFPSSELYQSYRSLGTIVCYHKHSVNDQPYANIGEQDITAHVNFSALDLWGRKNGLMNCGFATQSQFLSGLGLTGYLRKLELQEKNDIDFRKKFMLLHTLLVSMGRKFKVLIQQKGLQKPLLSGLQFCQPLV